MDVIDITWLYIIPRFNFTGVTRIQWSKQVFIILSTVTTLAHVLTIGFVFPTITIQNNFIFISYYQPVLPPNIGIQTTETVMHESLNISRYFDKHFNMTFALGLLLPTEILYISIDIRHICHYILTQQWDIISHPCSSLDWNSTKVCLTSEHGYVIISQIKPLM